MSLPFVPDERSDATLDAGIGPTNVHIKADTLYDREIGMAHVPIANTLLKLMKAYSAAGVGMRAMTRQLGNGVTISVATVENAETNSAIHRATITVPPVVQPEEDELDGDLDQPFLWVGVRRLEGGEQLYPILAQGKNPTQAAHSKPYIMVWEPPWNAIGSEYPDGRKNEVSAMLWSMYRYDSGYWDDIWHKRWIYGQQDMYSSWPDAEYTWLKDKRILPMGTPKTNLKGYTYNSNGLYFVEKIDDDVNVLNEWHQDSAVNTSNPTNGWSFTIQPDLDKQVKGIEDPFWSPGGGDEDNQFWDQVAILDPDESDYRLKPGLTGNPEIDVNVALQNLQDTEELRNTDWAGKPEPDREDSDELIGVALDPTSELDPDGNHSEYAVRILNWTYHRESTTHLNSFYPMRVRVRVYTGRGRNRTRDDFEFELKNPRAALDMDYDVLPGGFHLGFGGWYNDPVYGRMPTTDKHWARPEGFVYASQYTGPCRDGPHWSPTIFCDIYGGGARLADLSDELPWGVQSWDATPILTTYYWPDDFETGRYPNPQDPHFEWLFELQSESEKLFPIWKEDQLHQAEIIGGVFLANLMEYVSKSRQGWITVYCNAAPTGLGCRQVFAPYEPPGYRSARKHAYNPTNYIPIDYPVP